MAIVFSLWKKNSTSALNLHLKRGRFALRFVNTLLLGESRSTSVVPVKLRILSNRNGILRVLDDFTRARIVEKRATLTRR